MNNDFDFIDDFSDWFVMFVYKTKSVVIGNTDDTIGSETITYSANKTAYGFLISKTQDSIARTNITKQGYATHTLITSKNIVLSKDDIVIYNNKEYIVINQIKDTHLTNFFVFDLVDKT